MKINVIIHANIHTEKLAEARQLLGTLTTKTRLEDGCELYNFVLDGSRLLLAERWASQVHLDSHMQAAHFLICVPALKACCEEGVLYADIVQSESVNHVVI